jgi:hypothetical protein
LDNHPPYFHITDQNNNHYFYYLVYNNGTFYRYANTNILEPTNQFHVDLLTRAMYVIRHMAESYDQYLFNFHLEKNKQDSSSLHPSSLAYITTLNDRNFIYREKFMSEKYHAFDSHGNVVPNA